MTARMKKNGNTQLLFWTGKIMVNFEFYVDRIFNSSIKLRACAWVFFGGLLIAFFATVCSAPGIFYDTAEHGA